MTGENAAGSRIERTGHEDHSHGSIDSARIVTRMTIDTSALPGHRLFKWKTSSAPPSADAPQ
jgi:hypothetical protein